MTELAFLGKGGSKPKPPTRVSDNLRSEDTVELLIGLGEGPWKGLKDNSLRNLFVADTPIQAADGTINFPDAEVIFHKGTPDPEPILLFMGGTASGVGVGVNLNSGEAVTRTTTTGDIDAIDIRLRIDALFKTTDEGDYLDEELIYKIEIKQSSQAETEWTPLPTNAGWEELNPSPTYPSGPATGGYFTIEERSKHLQDTFGLSASQAESEVMNQLVENGTGAIEGPDFETYRNTLRVYGATQSPVVKEIRIPVERTLTDTYDIRITKISPETTNLSTREITWDIYELVSLERKAYPNTAMLQILLKSSDQLSNVPPIYGIYDTLEIKVPSIFDPETRNYDYSNGPWDGSFKIAHTDDLAWHIYNLIHNEDHGIAKYYNINFSKYEAEEASLWWNACDPLTGQYIGVPRPNGNGTRPRITYNNVIDSPRNSMELLTYMAGSGNAVFYEDAAGAFKLKVEKNEQAKHIFTQHDIVGEFVYTYTDVTSRYNDITVVYKNSDLPRYQEDRRRVFNQEDINLKGSKPFNFIAVGCTDTDEAIARANHKLITTLTEKETINFSTTRKGMYVEPHDIILVADPDMNNGESSRAVALSSDRLTITSFETFVPQGIAGDYKVSIQLSSGIFESPVSSFNEVEKTITLTTPVPTSVEDLFSFSISSTTYGELKAYRAIAINGDPKDYNQVNIVAIEVNLAKYNQVDNFDGSEFNTVAEIDTRPDNITGLNATINERETINGKVKDIEVTWNSSENISTGGVYVVYMSKDNGNRVEVQRSSSLGYKVLDAKLGKYQFTVAPVLLNGFVSTASRSVTVSIVAPDYGLPSVTGITIENAKEGNSPSEFIGKNVTVKWSVDTSVKWDGWDTGKPHPKFNSFKVDLVDNTTGLVAHTYVIEDWLEKELTVFHSDLVTYELTDIRDFSLVVSVADEEDNEGTSFTKNISKPFISLEGVSINQPESFSTRVVMSYNLIEDSDFKGVNAWVSQNVNQLGTLVWEGVGTPIFELAEGLSYITYEALDPFGASPKTTITYTLGLTDILTIIEENTVTVSELVETYGETATAAQSATEAAASANASDTSAQISIAASEVARLEGSNVRREALNMVERGVTSSEAAALSADNHYFNDGLTTWKSKPNLVVSLEMPSRAEIYSVIQENTEQTTYEVRDDVESALEVLGLEEFIEGLLNE